MVRDLHDDGMVERLATVLGPVEDELVERLSPKPGERWLDLGTGSGPVALRAAAAGAVVTAIETAAPMLEKARQDADALGLSIGSRRRQRRVPALRGRVL